LSTPKLNDLREPTEVVGLLSLRGVIAAPAVTSETGEQRARTADDEKHEVRPLPDRRPRAEEGGPEQVRPPEVENGRSPV